ncbi:MAG: hypothetical protein KC493_05415 [Bacteriovoracaceae bacterium]|nr:hypothetical protein [Bacteriovoracaceae bacterium]
MSFGKDESEDDEDNILDFGTPGESEEEVSTNDQTATDIQDPPEEEKLSHAETKILEKHGVLNEGWKSTYESELNEKIQAKFDRVFRGESGAGVLPDFDIAEPLPEVDEDADQDSSDNTSEDLSPISLDLGADDELSMDETPKEEASSPEVSGGDALSGLSDDEYLEESTKKDIVVDEISANEDDTGEFDVAELTAAPDESEEIINPEPNETPQNDEVKMTDHDDEDDILDFNIPDTDGDSADDSAEELDFGGAVEEEGSEETDEVGFSMEEEQDEDGESESVASDEDAGGLDFGSEDDLDLGGGDDEVVSASSEDDGDLDLGGGSEDLDLGSDDGGLDLGASDDIASSGDDGLDLGDDMDLDLSAEEVESSNASLDISDDLDLDAESDDLNLGDEETNEVETLASSNDEEDVEGGELLDFGADSDDDGVHDEATVATMLISSDDPSLESLKASQGEDALVDTISDIVAPEDEVDLASLIEEDDDDDEEDDVGFSLGEEEEDNKTETMMTSGEDETAEVTETMFSPDEEIDEDATMPTMVAPVSQLGNTFSPAAEDDKTIEITPPERRVASAYNEDELMRLQATIRQLREERDGLLTDINELKTDKKLVEQENLGLKAELDEVKIELTIVKKRHQDEIEEMNYRQRVAEEKKAISEEKSRQMQKEFDRLSQKVRIDFNQVKQREKELESQLELVTMDSESQVRSRDMKILELKRKIDQLEFNMENSQIKESKAKEDKVKIEDKLAKIMKTLRGSIQVLEDDLDLDEELIEKIKKV